MTTEQITLVAKKITENKISEKVLEDISDKIIDSLIRKHSQSTVAAGAQSEEDSEVNNVLTHIIEIWVVC